MRPECVDTWKVCAFLAMAGRVVLTVVIEFGMMSADAVCTYESLVVPRPRYAKRLSNRRCASDIVETGDSCVCVIQRVAI